MIFRRLMPGRWDMAESKMVRLMTPGPMMPTVSAFSTARCFTPTPGTAPVRYADSRFADMIAIGAPVIASFSTKTWTERGRSCLRFSALEPYHFTPAARKRPPRYAGIAMKRRSGPLAGMPSCSGLSGKLTCAPCEFAEAPAIR